MSAAIQVLAMRALDGTSTVKAFCDIRLGGVTLKGCKIVQQDAQKAWVATPSVKRDRRWNNVVEITSKDLRQRITDVVLAAWTTRQPHNLPTHGGRQTHETLDERADAWLQRQPLPKSGDPGRHDMDDPERPFDDDLPF
jgi:DNA-binding cell septation regulator SpoVG